MSSSITPIIEEIAQRLIAKKWHLATAESCTGGMVSAALTEIPGSSDWFERAYVTYSNQAKQFDLGVSEKILLNFGAVSTEVAQAMAEGLIQKTGIDIGLSITGVAGPSGGSPEKPVGFVCFAWSWQTKTGIKTRTASKHFLEPDAPITPATRSQVRKQARDFALQELLSILQTL